MAEHVALVTGVGGGTGIAVVRRFAAAGYRVAMMARHAGRLAEFAAEIAGTTSIACDVGDREALAAGLDAVRSRLGLPDVVVHNAVAATFARFHEVPLETFERNFRINCTSLLQIAQRYAPAMVERGHGAIIVTGNTSAYRGVPTYAGFAATKAAQRVLAQSLAKDLGPQQVHVAYVAIDAAIDAPWLGDMVLKPTVEPGRVREDYFAQPEAIADEVFHIAHQHPSTWSFDHVIRPFTERWTLG